MKNGQAVIVNKCRKENAWDSGERRVIEGLAEHDLPDILRLLNGYEKSDFSGYCLVRKDYCPAAF